MEQNGKGKATASLVLGIISLVFILFCYTGDVVTKGIVGLIVIATAIIGIVLGISAKKSLPQDQASMATAGLIMSIIALALAVISFFACVACIFCAGLAGVSILGNL